MKLKIIENERKYTGGGTWRGRGERRVRVG